MCPESVVVEYLGIASFWCRDLSFWRCGVFQRFSDLTTSFVSNFLGNQSCVMFEPLNESASRDLSKYILVLDPLNSFWKFRV